MIWGGLAIVWCGLAAVWGGLAAVRDSARAPNNTEVWEQRVPQQHVRMTAGDVRCAKSPVEKPTPSLCGLLRRAASLSDVNCCDVDGWCCLMALGKKEVTVLMVAVLLYLGVCTDSTL